jgi:phosphoribosylamine--glycine ligase
MSLKVLLIGNGAREHAIAKKIVENDGVLFSYMSRENPGIADLSKKFMIGDLSDFEKLNNFKRVDYAIVGPENPIADGVTNYFHEMPFGCI